jgi:hypothetical protein
MKLTQQQVLGIIRHILTFGGGILVTKGLLDEGMVAEISGAVITLIGAVWSIIEKSKAA